MKIYRNWIIIEVVRAMTKGEHTNERTYVRTYSHTYIRDRPYIPSTTLLCEGIKTGLGKNVLFHIFVISIFMLFSLPEHAQCQILGYCDVRGPSYMWTSQTSVMSVHQLFACVHSRGHSFDRIFLKLGQNVYLYNI